MLQTSDFTPKSYMNINKLLFSALLMGVVIITVVFVAITPQQEFSASNDQFFSIMVPIISIIGLAVSRGTFNQFVKQAKEKKSLKEKLLIYRVGLLIGLALCEAPAIYANIAFMNHSNQFYLIFTILCLLVMMTYKPSEKKVIKDLNLRNDELDTFRAKETKIK